MSMYAIELADGRRLENLTMNGNMFVSQEEIAIDDLDAEALEEVTITEYPEEGGEIDTTIENAVCDGVLHWPEGYLFNLREEDPRDKALRELREDTETALNELLDFVVGGDEE